MCLRRCSVILFSSAAANPHCNSIQSGLLFNESGSRQHYTHLPSTCACICKTAKRTVSRLKGRLLTAFKLSCCVGQTLNIHMQPMTNYSCQPTSVYSRSGSQQTQPTQPTANPSNLAQSMQIRQVGQTKCISSRAR